MTLKPGTQLGPYEIVAPIGAGGMGEVYRARDPRVGRDVALKVSAEQFNERFEREIRAVASLNHSNICTLYDVGPDYLVMELVEGPTLAERIKQGPILLEESLEIARQIADALEAAHEKGIVHRDLKPANIKIKPDGTVKVLDFGLAKVGGTPAVSSDNSPTLSVAQTAAGVILGTAAYMSPEQAKGKVVDKRADIWAFGCVLYEMLTGQAAFQGEDVSEILASVIKGDVNLDLLPTNLHPRVREVVSHCLQKDQKKRYRDIGDVRFELERKMPWQATGEPVADAESQSRLRPRLLWIAATAVVCLMIGAVVAWNLKVPEPRPVMRFSCILPENLRFVDNYRGVVISPDGSQIVYNTTGGLYLQTVGKLDDRLIPGTEGGQLRTPFFSPDGYWIGYYSMKEQQLKKVSVVTSGVPVKICDVKSALTGTWCLDNTIIFNDFGRLLRVSSDGGTPETIVEKQNEIITDLQILPDGENVLLSLEVGVHSQIVVHSLLTGKRQILFPGTGARYLPTGYLVYQVEDNLFTRRFNPEKLVVEGGPVSIIQGIRPSLMSQYSVSNSGTLVYVPGAGVSASRILVWVDRNGKEEAIEAQPRAYAYARLSPDGMRVALDIRDQENDIYIWDLARKTLSRLTFDPGMNRGPVWTPDGKRLAFSAERDGTENIYWQAADGSGNLEALTKLPNVSISPHSFSPDGKQLLFSENNAPRHINLLELNGAAAPRRLLESAFDEQNPQISPDGRWLAYASNESAGYQIYVRPFPNVNAGKWQISAEGGTRPLWNKNGHELFYYVEPGTMMAVPVETGVSFKAGTPKIIFKGPYLSPQAGLQYSVTSDGQRFLMIKDATTRSGAAVPPQQINIVLNWFEELKRRVPAGKN